MGKIDKLLKENNIRNLLKIYCEFNHIFTMKFNGFLLLNDFHSIFRKVLNNVQIIVIIQNYMNNYKDIYHIL